MPAPANRCAWNHGTLRQPSVHPPPRRHPPTPHPPTPPTLPPRPSPPQAVIDYCRFMAGWGWWGATRYAGRRCKEALPRLKGALAKAKTAAAVRKQAVQW